MESDAEFLDGLIGRPITVSDRVRLFALARRGAAAQLAKDDQFARIQNLETALQDLAEIALKLEKERDSLKAAMVLKINEKTVSCRRGP